MFFQENYLQGTGSWFLYLPILLFHLKVRIQCFWFLGRISRPLRTAQFMLMFPLVLFLRAWSGDPECESPGLRAKMQTLGPALVTRTRNQEPAFWGVHCARGIKKTKKKNKSDYWLNAENALISFLRCISGSWGGDQNLPVSSYPPSVPVCTRLRLRSLCIYHARRWARV